MPSWVPGTAYLQCTHISDANDARTKAQVAYPPPVDDAQPSWYVLDGVEIRLPFVHPGVSWDDGSFITVEVLFRVGIVDVGAGRLEGHRSLANMHGLDTRFTLQGFEVFEKLDIKINVSASKVERWKNVL